MDTLARIAGATTPQRRRCRPAPRAAQERRAARGLPATRDESWRYAKPARAEPRARICCRHAPRPPTSPRCCPTPLPGFQRLVLHDGRRVAALLHPARALPAATARRKPRAGAHRRCALRAAEPHVRAADAGAGPAPTARSWRSSASRPPRRRPPPTRACRCRSPRAHTLELVERHLGAAGAQSLVCRRRRPRRRRRRCARSLPPAAAAPRTCCSWIRWWPRWTASATWHLRMAACGAAAARTTALVRLAGRRRRARLARARRRAPGSEQRPALRVEHAAPRTRSEQLFRGIATERGHAACSARDARRQRGQGCPHRAVAARTARGQPLPRSTCGRSSRSTPTRCRPQPRRHHRRARRERAVLPAVARPRPRHGARAAALGLPRRRAAPLADRPRCAAPPNARPRASSAPACRTPWQERSGALPRPIATRRAPATSRACAPTSRSSRSRSTASRSSTSTTPPRRSARARCSTPSSTTRPACTPTCTAACTP